MFASKNFKISSAFFLVGFIAFLIADLSVSSIDTAQLVNKFLFSIVDIQFNDYSVLLEAFLTTIAIAILAILSLQLLDFF